MNPGRPDLEFKVLTVLSDTPPNWKRIHRNQAKKQSDGLVVLVIKTKSKWWKISHVMGRLMPESHMEVGCPGTYGLEPPTPNPGSKNTPKVCPTCNPAMSPASHTQPRPKHPHTELRFQWRNKDNNNTNNNNKG